MEREVRGENGHPLPSADGAAWGLTAAQGLKVLGTATSATTCPRSVRCPEGLPVGVLVGPRELGIPLLHVGCHCPRASGIA